MRRRAALGLAFGALLTAACNLTIPQATPTIAPTRTPSVTPLVQPSSTPTVLQTPTAIALRPSATQTPRASGTPAPTRTPSQFPSPTETSTSDPSATSTPSVTLPSTASPIPTLTPSLTMVPSVTPLPALGPTRTPSPTSRPTLTPSLSPTPSPSQPPLPAPSSTPAAFAPIGVRETPTAAQTLDVTPTLVTAQPGDVAAAVSPIAPTFTALPLALTAFPTLTPQTAPTAALQLPPTALGAPPILPGSLPNLAYTLDTSGGFSGAIAEMPGGTLTLASDPNNPDHVALVDARGLLYIYSNFSARQGGRLEASPFSFPEPPNAETNQARVTQVAYAPTGRWVAFLVDTDNDSSGDNDSSNDGVYVVPLDPTSGQPNGGAVMLLRDCPPEPGCVIVNRPDAPYRYRSLDFAWSPAGDALLVELELPEEERRGITVLYPALGAATSATRPPVLRYDYGSWTNDGERIIVSGRAPDGRVVFGSITRDGGDAVLRDVSGIGLSWAQSAVQHPNGQIVMLGSSGGASALRLYREDGAALTGDIGTTPPVRVTWSPDRSAALVVTLENGLPEYWVAFVSGEVRRITGDLGGALAVEWRTR